MLAHGDGSVLTWGDADFGGDCSTVTEQLAGGVNIVVAARFAVAALNSDGSALTWGAARYDGDCGVVAAQLADI